MPTDADAGNNSIALNLTAVSKRGALVKNATCISPCQPASARPDKVVCENRIILSHEAAADWPRQVAAQVAAFSFRTQGHSTDPATQYRGKGRACTGREAVELACRSGVISRRLSDWDSPQTDIRAPLPLPLQPA